MQIRNRRYSKQGERLYSNVRVKVFRPGNAGADVVKYHAGQGKGFTAAEIDKILDDAADKVARAYPLHEYRLVPITRTMFNLVWEGMRVDGEELATIENELQVKTIESEASSRLAAARSQGPTQPRQVGFSEQRCTLCGGALLTSGVCSFIECPNPMNDLQRGLVANDAAREAAL